ncbi:hypothetical protein NQ318_005799 [Aromia moschata]|uniref:ubiquitinyl hydrolase 1 n=1 Tax=Aromia moschata TaxID=1265417 RepID=A0AAV8YRW8_9CUCU|nr:hypothetical protein NQ318_005799 [Aromia moschata]
MKRVGHAPACLTAPRVRGGGAESARAKPRVGTKARTRLESTSLLRTPIIDEHLKDYHQHQLLAGQDPFDLKYQLYAVVSHSGLLNGGHYISYACNPNGHWYCYNDSSCREVLTNDPDSSSNRGSQTATPKGTGCTPLSRRKNILRKLSTGSNASDDLEKRDKAPLATLDATLSSTDTLDGSPSGSVTSMDKCGVEKEPPAEIKMGSEDKLLRDSPYGSRRSLNSFRCPYGDVKPPKIDTSTAYILFYERSGLDYKPYLPKVVPNGIGKQVPLEDLDESESELRKQLCCIQ